MKRVPGLRELSDEHHTGLVLARRCKQAGPSSGTALAVWRRVLDAFSSELEPHFQIEERYLLPALESIGEAALAGRIREEHEVLRGLIGAEAPSPALIERFGELLESHIRFEERQVFATTQERLPARALDDIRAACEARRKNAPSSPDALID